MKKLKNLDRVRIDRLPVSTQHIIYEIFYASQFKLEKDAEELDRLLVEGTSLISSLSEESIKLLKNRQGKLEMAFKNRFREYFSFYRHLSRLIVRLKAKGLSSYLEIGPGNGGLYRNLIGTLRFQRSIFVEPDTKFGKNLLERFDHVTVVPKIRDLQLSVLPRDCLACSTDLLEHLLPEERDILTSIYKSILSRGGMVVTQTPNRFTGPHDVSRRVLCRGDRAAGFHLQEFSFRELQELFISEDVTLVSPLLYHRTIGYFGPLVSSSLKVKLERYIVKIFSGWLRERLVRFFALDILIVAGNWPQDSESG